MTWSDARDLWSRLDGSVWFGVTVYLYLTRRRAIRERDAARRTAEKQNAIIERMIKQGFMIVMQGQSGTDGSDRMH